MKGARNRASFADRSLSPHTRVVNNLQQLSPGQKGWTDFFWLWIDGEIRDQHLTPDLAEFQIYWHESVGILKMPVL